VSDPTSRQVAGALSELDRLAQKRATLRDSCRIQAAIIEAIYAKPATESPLVVQADDAQAKLARGVPLLRDLPLPVDEAAFNKRWQAVCAALAQPDAQALAAAVNKDTLKPLALLGEVLAGRPEAVAARAEVLGLNAALTATVLRLAAFPALARLTQSCKEYYQNSSWENGYCPNCGSWPLLGEARGLEQDRILRCGLCAAGWKVDRLFCPFCGNRDHRTLGYLHLEGEEDHYRAGSCEACQGYVKWVTAMFALSEPQLLVADLATVHLDLAAAERGFFVP